MAARLGRSDRKKKRKKAKKRKREQSDTGASEQVGAGDETKHASKRQKLETGSAGVSTSFAGSEIIREAAAAHARNKKSAAYSALFRDNEGDDDEGETFCYRNISVGGSRARC